MDLLKTGNLNNRNPKNLNDCIEPDYVSTNLKLWAERIESWGGILCVVFVVAGLIVAIMSARYVEDYSYFGGAEYGFNGGTFFSVLIPYVIYSVITFIVCKVIKFFLEGLADIVYNTKVSTDLAILNYKNSYEKSVVSTVVTESQNVNTTETGN